ncbi:MAG TPA: Asp-tRNA(Asn)/Glu-tRNA(Gln) amidotransferase subunit GatA [Polyangiaceae bacterium]|jgi:aspartyl-tRNA(Asn)/glutamyl-tRNA(Gln) amidotransferase subunit A|nr:Asp-tRNA(Asn)/Glu-tRNA(Gln) amidotransferase subunit GatA [Polyangiaceae bacterium]
MTHPLDLPISELASLVERGEVSAESVTRESLARIDAKRGLNALLHVANEGALEAARALDVRRARGEPLGPLAGVPIALKDALCTFDQPTTSGSKVLVRAKQGKAADSPEGGWRPPYDATVVARLRAAGAIMVGKANMDELAMGSSNENSAFGPVRNPWDPSRTPGGSSGGSAASVAAGLAAGALGSDTGGSIRQPAGLTGIVGVKPSYGRVSRRGLVAFASSLDQVGPFAVDVRSSARLLEVIAGRDALDSTSSSRPVGRYEAACDEPVRGLRIGVPREYFAEGLDAEVESSVRAAIAALEREGCTIHDVEMPHTRYGLATYYVVATAEASSNLARLDGVRFGLRTEAPGANLAELYASSRGAGFGAEVKRRIMLGTYALAAGYYDAYYKKAQQVRTLIKRDFDEAFTRVDALLTPISPTPAFKLGEKVDDPVKMYLSDVYTLPASLAGVCALSVPCAPAPATSTRPTLPIGLQVIAPSFAEERMFQVAAAWERLSPARTLRPPS